MNIQNNFVYKSITMSNNYTFIDKSITVSNNINGANLVINNSTSTSSTPLAIYKENGATIKLGVNDNNCGIINYTTNNTTFGLNGSLNSITINTSAGITNILPTQFTGNSVINNVLSNYQSNLGNGQANSIILNTSGSIRYINSTLNFGVTGNLDALSIGSNVTFNSIVNAVNITNTGNITGFLFASSTTTTSTDIILSNTSNSTQFLTGTTQQTVTLPDATTLQVGANFSLINRGTLNAIVRSNTILTIVPGTSKESNNVSVVLIDNTTSSGVWSIQNQNNITTQNIGTSGYLYNSNTTGTTIITDTKVLSKRIRSSRGSVTRGLSTWISNTTALTALNWSSICWSPEINIFVIGNNGGNQTMGSSADGITWTSNTVSSGIGFYNSICWSPENGRFVTVSSNNGIASTTNIMHSTNGTSWTQLSGLTASILNSICWCPENALFVAVGGNGTTGYIATSNDGTTSWVISNSSVTGTTPVSANSICWSPELLIFVVTNGVSTNGIYYSSSATPTAVSWIPVAIDGTNINFTSVAWSPELYLFVAVGSASINTVYTSPDGINWATRQTGTTMNSYQVIWVQELSIFVVSGTNGIITSIDGLTWTTRNTGNAVRCVEWSRELSELVAPIYGTSNILSTNPILVSERSTLLTNSNYVNVNSVGKVTINGNSTALYNEPTGPKLVIYGNVNTGITNPAIDGQTILTGQTNTNTRLGIGLNTQTNVGSIQAFNGSPLPLILNAIKLGIGKNSPSYGIDMNSYGTISSQIRLLPGNANQVVVGNNIFLSYGFGENNKAVWGFNYVSDGNSTNAVSIGTNVSPQVMNVTSRVSSGTGVAGCVGINVVDPLYNLHINGRFHTNELFVNRLNIYDTYATILSTSVSVNGVVTITLSSASPVFLRTDQTHAIIISMCNIEALNGTWIQNTVISQTQFTIQASNIVSTGSSGTVVFQNRLYSIQGPGGFSFSKRILNGGTGNGTGTAKVFAFGASYTITGITTGTRTPIITTSNSNVFALTNAVRHVVVITSITSPNIINGSFRVTSIPTSTTFTINIDTPITSFISGSFVLAPIVHELIYQNPNLSSWDLYLRGVLVKQHLAIIGGANTDDQTIHNGGRLDGTVNSTISTFFIHNILGTTAYYISGTNLLSNIIQHILVTDMSPTANFMWYGGSATPMTINGNNCVQLNTTNTPDNNYRLRVTGTMRVQNGIFVNTTTTVYGSTICVIDASGTPTHSLGSQSTGTFSNVNFTQGTTTPAVRAHTILAMAILGELKVSSDIRIKKIINEKVDTSVLDKLKLVKYNYKDHILQGTSTKIGFIAQDVKELIKDSISFAEDFIPNIYQHITIQQNQTITLINHNLKENDILNIKVDDKEVKGKDVHIKVLKVIDENSFIFKEETKTDLLQPDLKVFLYGKKINDLHVLNHNYIFCIGFEAVKELRKDMKTKTNDIEDIIRKIDKLEEMVMAR